MTMSPGRRVAGSATAVRHRRQQPQTAGGSATGGGSYCHIGGRPDFVDEDQVWVSAMTALGAEETAAAEDRRWSALYLKPECISDVVDNDMSAASGSGLFRPDKQKDMSKTATTARMRADGTAVEVMSDGSERPFPHTPMRALTEAEIEAAAAADPMRGL